MLDVKKVKYHPSPNLRVAATRWFERRLIYKGKSYPVKNLLLIAAALLLIIFLAVYFLLAYGKNQSDPNLAIQKETKELTDHIGRFMELPTGEQPTLATVTDQDKLKGQDFFAHAQNGDKLLVWPVARKAILFRPSTGKIIEVSNLVSGAAGQSQPSTDMVPSTENSSQ
ncbi:MAG: hypothetical protein NT170_02205 [Candidatus Moranbacteria bacterium]|nr:hypothetical protein [Candidatus Moranbacteria bacterium]